MGDFFIAVAELSINVWNRTIEIISQPSLNKEMLWILLPLLTVLILMQFYFGHYKKEELGWNSAVANSIVLFFVGMNLLSYLYANNILIFQEATEKIAVIKSLIAIIIVVEAFLLMLIDFFHLFPKHFAFEISSPLILNFIGAMSIIFIYSDLPFDYISLIAVLFIFICTVIIFRILRVVEPSVKDDVEEKTEGEQE